MTPYGSTLPTIRAGAGPLILLCHGITDSAAALSDLQRRLSDHYLVIAIDSLAHGLARRATVDDIKTPMASALSALTDTVRALVHEHGPAVGIGHSMGGALLTKLAWHHPELFAGVVAEDPAWLSTRQRQDYELNIPASLAFHHDLRAHPSAALDANRSEFPQWNDAERSGWLAAKQQVDLEFLAAGDVGYTDWHEWIPHITVPTLVITGDASDVVLGSGGIKDVDQLANPHITTLVIPGARHCVRRDEPELFHEALDAFLDEIHPPWDPNEAIPRKDTGVIRGVQPSQTAAFYIDPELAPALDAPYFPQWDPAATRERAAAANSRQVPITSRASLEIHEIAGIEVRVWSPHNPKRVMLSLHGGGLTAGAARYDDPHNAEMAEVFQAVVVSPEYRLAPEHPYPAAATDALSTAQWAFNRWDLPTAIYGDSAGGSLSETVAAMLLDRDERVAQHVIAVEPFLDPALAGMSQRTHADAQTWNRDKAYHAWHAYLAGSHPSILPRLIHYATNPRKPRVFTAVASADLLRDEGIRWTTDLVDAGFDAELSMMPGTFHSALSIPHTRVWLQLRQRISDFLDSHPTRTS